MMKKSIKSKSLPDKQANFLLYTGKDGKVNVEVIISVGYRFNSYQATQFRILATKTLKEYKI